MICILNVGFVLIYVKYKYEIMFNKNIYVNLKSSNLLGIFMFTFMVKRNRHGLC